MKNNRIPSENDPTTIVPDIWIQVEEAEEHYKVLYTFVDSQKYEFGYSYEFDFLFQTISSCRQAWESLTDMVLPGSNGAGRWLSDSVDWKPFLGQFNDELLEAIRLGDDLFQSFLGEETDYEGTPRYIDRPSLVDFLSRPRKIGILGGNCPVPWGLFYDQRLFLIENEDLGFDSEQDFQVQIERHLTEHGMDNSFFLRLMNCFWGFRHTIYHRRLPNRHELIQGQNKSTSIYTERTQDDLLKIPTSVYNHVDVNGDGFTTSRHLSDITRLPNFADKHFCGKSALERELRRDCSLGAFAYFFCHGVADSNRDLRKKSLGVVASRRKIRWKWNGPKFERK